MVSRDYGGALLQACAKVGVVGTTVHGYGALGLNGFQTGLVGMGLPRGEGSFNTINAVQSGLVMGTPGRLGNEEEQRWLPPLARLDKRGAFSWFWSTASATTRRYAGASPTTARSSSLRGDDAGGSHSEEFDSGRWRNPAAAGGSGTSSSGQS